MSTAAAECPRQYFENIVWIRPETFGIEGLAGEKGDDGVPPGSRRTPAQVLRDTKARLRAKLKNDGVGRFVAFVGAPKKCRIGQIKDMSSSEQTLTGHLYAPRSDARLAGSLSITRPSRGTPIWRGHAFRPSPFRGCGESWTFIRAFSAVGRPGFLRKLAGPSMILLGMKVRW